MQIIPGLAGFTPMTSVCLLADSKQSRLRALLSMLIYITFSNIVVFCVWGMNTFGLWCLFTYGAYAVIVLLGKQLNTPHRFRKLAAFVAGASLFFWLVSNFGWWLTTAFYPKNPAGLMQCYIAALPFLRNSLIGNFCFAAVVYFLRTYMPLINMFMATTKLRAHIQ
jgi:hypothetical protein